jgi:hypothetical protein
MRVYHTTTFNNLKSILDKGLIPQYSNGAGINYDNPTQEELESFKGYVFLATTLKKAKTYLDCFDEDCVIIYLDIPKEELLPDYSDCFDCKSYQESNRRIQQVSTKKIIDYKFIKKIIFKCTL